MIVVDSLQVPINFFYKIITGKYQGCVAPSLLKEENYVTRGNDIRLQKLRVRYDLRKFGFCTSRLLRRNSNNIVKSITNCDVRDEVFCVDSKRWSTICPGVNSLDF